MLRFVLALSALLAATAACATTAPAGSTTDVEALTFAVTPRVITVDTTADSTGRSVELQLPVVSGGPPGVAARINAALSAETLLGVSVEELRADNVGIVGASFEVTRRAAPVLALVVTVDLVGFDAYRSITGYAFDAASGDQITARALFAPARLDALVARLDAELQVAIARASAEAGAAGDLETVERLAELRFDFDTLERFRIGTAGITFSWTADPGGAHDSLGVEPADPHLPWADVAPFLAPRFHALAAD